MICLVTIQNKTLHPQRIARADRTVFSRKGSSS